VNIDTGLFLLSAWHGMPSFGFDTTRISLWKWCSSKGAGPAAERGSFGGDGTANNRPDEPNSGLEQTHTVSNVGATPPSLWIIWALSTSPH